jgi:phosphoribosylglycinamide formyltransferase-1
MRQLIYDPDRRGGRMTIACFISGSGTNYREIAAGNPDHNYIVFTNRPGCDGTDIARANRHKVIELSHASYLSDARKRYSPGNVPRNCPERIKYEQDLCRLLEDGSGGEPDLVCLAGYDQWLTDWIVDRYYPRILNVHPGDTTRGYVGLHWIHSAEAILAGDETVRSTLFIVDKGEDTGPVLVQSRPLNIRETLVNRETGGRLELLKDFSEIASFIEIHSTKSFKGFKAAAGAELISKMENICVNLQNALKVKGDWEIYPLAVHDLIAPGRIAIDGRVVYIDGKEMPESGYQPTNEYKVR